MVNNLENENLKNDNENRQNIIATYYGLGWFSGCILGTFGGILLGIIIAVIIWINLAK